MIRYNVLSPFDQQMVRLAVKEQDRAALDWLSKLPEAKAIAAGHLVLRLVEGMAHA